MSTASRTRKAFCRKLGFKENNLKFYNQQMKRCLFIMNRIYHLKNIHTVNMDGLRFAEPNEVNNKSVSWSRIKSLDLGLKEENSEHQGGVAAGNITVTGSLKNGNK